MASPPSTETAGHPPTPTSIRDVIGHDDDDDHDFVIAEEDEEDEDEDEWDVSKRMSRLSMEGSDGGDADDENGGEGVLDEEEDDFLLDDEVRSDVNDGTYSYLPLPAPVPSSASLPGTPDRATGASSQPWRWPAGPSGKEYASETEARWPPATGRRRRHQYRHRPDQRVIMREVWLERAWRMRKQRRQQHVPVVVLGGGGDPSASSTRVAMDVEEVRACRDLGLDLPCDCAVEIPCYYALSAGVDTASSGGNSPASGGSWRISSPGDDPKDVKARLKVWAQAVALASASRLAAS